MWLSRNRTKRQPARRKPPSARLSLETLEERCVPTTVPNDPLFHHQYGPLITEADRAWDLTTGSTRVVVADIDRGVDYTHPDLYKNIWINQPEIPAAVRQRLQDVDDDGLITFWDLNEPVNFQLVGPPTPRPDSVAVPPDPNTQPS